MKWLREMKNSTKMEAGKKIDIDKIDMEKEAEKVAANPGILAYPHHAGSALVKPEDRGKIRGRSVAAMYEQTDRELNQIYEQMQLLARQAKDIQSRVEVSERIYKAQVSFEPIIGRIYYLYSRADGDDVLSMIAPTEWGRSQPFQQYISKVKLLSDHTWEILESHVG
tara:strand:+ start:287 stop:787 length:501 start_codon:yes stop_codon:yes gene_type:complete